MRPLERARHGLFSHQPVLIDPSGRSQASVAVVLREREGDFDVLFIERAEREGDPWSGHMAFPGGRVDARDAGAREAAEREVLEEVGLPLHTAERLGRLDDAPGRHAGRALPLLISAFVYNVTEERPVVTNHEVREALWVGAARLLDPAHHVEYIHPALGARFASPGIVVGDPDRHVIWGLTYRILHNFFEAFGSSLPAA